MRTTSWVGYAIVFAVVAGWLLGAACSTPTNVQENNPTISSGDCRDGDCPLGEECDGGACVPCRPTVYPHIQLASVLLRPYLDIDEVYWRARNFDLLIGHASRYADQIRSENPNLRLFEYADFRHHTSLEDGEEWAAANGYSAEDFFLHYRQDVNLHGFESIILVPGYPAGFVPGWNPEPSPGDPPATAPDRASARSFGYPGPRHDPWRMANITDPGYRRFLIDRMEQLVDGSFEGDPNLLGPVDGIMVDYGVWYPNFNEGQLNKTVEFHQYPLDDSHPYAVGFVTFYPELEEALESRLGQPVDLMPNFSHVFYLGDQSPLSQGVLQAVDWIWPEVWMIDWGNSLPIKGINGPISYDRDYEIAIVNVVRQTRAGGRRVLGGRDLFKPPIGTDRGRLFTLSLYYLVHNANTFYLYESFNGHYCSDPLYEWQWNPAVEYDIGLPAPVPDGYVDFEGKIGTTEHFELASGPDPYDGSLTYHVLARMFTGGMVLVKMLPLGSEIDERSYTVHPLDRPYRILRADGTVGDEWVTEVSIRNNEGIILVLP